MHHKELLTLPYIVIPCVALCLISNQSLLSILTPPLPFCHMYINHTLKPLASELPSALDRTLPLALFLSSL